MEDTCGALIKRLNDKLQKRANNTLQDRQITITQLAVLVELEQKPAKTMSMKEVEAFLQVAQSTTAGILARLHQKKYISVFTSEDDKRVKVVQLTKTGHDLCVEGFQHMRETEEMLLSPLNADERTVFLRLLRRVCEACH